MRRKIRKKGKRKITIYVILDSQSYIYIYIYIYNIEENIIKIMKRKIYKICFFSFKIFMYFSYFFLFFHFFGFNFLFLTFFLQQSERIRKNQTYIFFNTMSVLVALATPRLIP